MVAGGLAVAGALIAMAMVATRGPRPTTTPPASTPRTALPGSAATAPTSPKLAELLRRVEEAVGEGFFTQPTGESALDLLRQAEAEAPSDPRPAAARARIARTLEGAGDRLAAAGMSRSARTLYEEAHLFDPSSTRLAEVARSEGAGARSGAPASQAARPEVGLARIAWLLSQVQLAVADGRYLKPAGKNALEFLVQLKQLDPSGVRSNEARQVMTANLRRKADELWRRGDFAAALPIYQLVLALDPGDALARGRLKSPASPVAAAPAAAAPARPRPAPTGEQPLPEEQSDPTRAKQLVGEGRRALSEGKLADARERFLAALKASPRNPAALTGLASVAFEQASYPQAIELARKALGQSRGEVQAQLVLGDACFNLLRYDEARKAWEEVLRLDPGNRSAARRLEKLKSAPR